VSEGLGELFFTDLNLTGHGDPLELRWGLLKWQKDGTVEYADFDNLYGAYEFPVSPWGTTLRVHADRSDSSVIDETFAELGITSRNEEFGLTLRQPFYETLTNSVSVSISADRKHSETFLLGQPFTLSLGALDGETDVFATRLAIDWVNRSSRHVLALRSVFSLGLYAFGATRADPRTAQDSLSGGDPKLGLDPEIPDSKFFSWLGQAQLVARIFDTATLRAKPDEYRWNVLRETQLIVRANAQLSDEPLLSLEQFSLGGMQSVRGYRENQLLRDDGVFASAELRVPIWLAKDKTPIVALAPFFDFGAGWNINKLDDRYQAISSAGIGVLVKATKHAQVSVYWGHPFKDFKEEKTSLQDYGVHFAVVVNGF
jgi:hemolysin activation/secretion protein